MPWVAEPGATFLCPSGPGDKSHLYVVITPPLSIEGHPPGVVLVVPVCSIKEGLPYDDSCTIPGGRKAHPFCRHDSFVSYAHAELRQAIDLEKLTRQGYYKPNDPLDADNVAILLTQLSASPRTKGALKKFAKAGAFQPKRAT